MNKLFKAKKVRKISFYLIVFLILLIIFLAFFVIIFPVMPIDLKISSELQSEGEVVRPFIMRFVSQLGNFYPAIVTVITASILYLVTGNRKEAIFVYGVFIADLINVGIKLLVNRPRPTEEFVNVLHKLSDPSFPSGHVVHFTVFFGFVILTMFTIKGINHSLRILISVFSLSLISLISVSRVYLGAHWFTDVVAGYLVGLLLLFFLINYYLSDVIKSKKNG